MVGGIPDLRTGHGAWVDLVQDRRLAEELDRSVDPADVEGAIRCVFVRRGSVMASLVERRVAAIMDAPVRLREECAAGWLRPVIGTGGPILEIGCGPGVLLAEIPGTLQRYGVDVSLEWLVVARRLAAAAGVHVDLAAAHAEALPLLDRTMAAVVALDVIEHVGDQAATVREIDRVMMSGGVFAAATPNRFSIAAEPHVGVWGVGWLPRAWQRRYVRWRADLPYEYVRLLGYSEFLRLIRRNTSLRAAIDAAPIPETAQRRFSRRRQFLARTYNGLLSAPGFASIARRIGAFFHLVAHKP